MLQPVPEQDTEKSNGWIRKTSQKILAIGAGLRAFLLFTDRIVFSPEPVHQPDEKFIDELVKLLEKTSPSNSQGGD